MRNTNQGNSERSKRPSRKKFDRVNGSSFSSDDEEVDEDEQNNTNNHITVTILDSAQNKFELSLPPDATVLEFKRIGHEVHSVSPDKQRLVSMGQLLKDDKSITDHKITNRSIIHLFPKPNVVVTDSNAEPNSPPASPTGAGSENASGAHVPQIVMNSDEVNRQSSILILSTHEAYETMHRIRLLSFLLLMYSSIQMLRDISIYLAPPMEDENNTIIPPGDPTDTGMPGQYGEYDEQLPQWQNRDFFEMGICLFGIYVASLGIKSTSENIGLAYSKRFMVLLGVLGVLWNAYLYYCYVDELKARESQEDYDSGKVYSDALFAIALPLMLWLLFFLRSIQFYTLVLEAETDATERSSRLASSIVNPSRSGDGNENGDEEFGGRSGYDLEMQTDTRSIV